MRRLLLLAVTTALIGVGLAHTLACGGGHGRARDYPTTPNMNARRYQTLQRQAAQDLTCGSDQLQYTYAPDGMHTMTGCGGAQSYYLHCPSGWCVWMSSPVKQAAFDLNCPVDQLQLVNIDQAKWGVTGCNARATYSPLCQAMTCQWFQDAAGAMGQAGAAQPSSGDAAPPSQGTGTAPALEPAPSHAPAPAGQPEPGLAPATPGR
jgi:hypothetical protein